MVKCRVNSEKKNDRYKLIRIHSKKRNAERKKENNKKILNGNRELHVGE